LPDDVNIFVTSDDAVFIRGSIEEVLKTLALAVAIVVVVIFLFLRDLRATLIPALTMPVALIGTLAAIYLVGFSINILTLLALVLATGMVSTTPSWCWRTSCAAFRRHGAARRRRARHAAGVLRRRHDDCDAGRRLRAAVVPAGAGRGPVPGIRLHARHGGGAVFRRGADALPGAGKPLADGGRRGQRIGAGSSAGSATGLPPSMPGRCGARWPTRSWWSSSRASSRPPPP
jgi:hypothetical protein